MANMNTFRTIPEEPYYLIHADGEPTALPVQLEDHHLTMLRKRFLECPICSDKLSADAAQVTCCYTLFCRTCMLDYAIHLRQEGGRFEVFYCPWCNEMQGPLVDDMVDQLQSSAASLKLSEENRRATLSLFNRLCPQARFKFMSYVCDSVDDNLVIKPPSIREPQLRAEIFKECPDTKQKAALRTLLNDRANNLTRIQHWFYSIQRQFDCLFSQDLLRVPTRFGTAERRYRPVLKSRLLRTSAVKLRRRRMRAVKITRSKQLRKQFREMY